MRQLREVDTASAVGGNEGFPHEKVAQQTFERVRVLRPFRFFAFEGDIASETDNSVHQLAVSIERTLVAAV